MSMVDLSLTLVERGNALEIRSAEEYQTAAEFLKGATALDRSIGEHYRPLKQQADQLHAALVEAEKVARRPIANVIDRIKGMMLGYEALEKAKAKAEQERLQALADKQAKKTGVPAPVIQVPLKLKTEGINRVTWDVEVDNPELVPDEYWTIDHVKLRQAAVRMREQFNVPGCHVVRNENKIVKGV